MSTKIEWTEETWNPIVGCDKISPGCQNCYAEKMAKRLVGMGQKKYYPVVNRNGWTGKTNLDESALDKPLHWKKPRIIFVVSMGDLFHESVPFEWILEVMYVINKCPQHTFQVLTKRPERMREFLMECVSNPFSLHFEDLPNMWLGVTAENQEQADKRIPILLQIPAAKRFVSIEPMLELVDIRNYLPVIAGHDQYHHENGDVDWVICGSESGPGRRECGEDWVRSLRDQCVNANIPFFLKQLHRDKEKVALPELDGVIYNQKP